MTKAAARRHLGKRPANFSAVMAGLLMPVLDADLTDPELGKLEVKAARMAKKRAEDAWHLAWLRQETAHHAHDAMDKRRCIATFHPGQEHGYDEAALRTLRAEWVDAIDAMMRLPAPYVRGLRWKQAHDSVVREWTPAGLAAGPNPEWVRYIAADEARLRKMASTKA